jgi:NAD(P)-dependent dehydrogenase (short-subunit alcohol dehydrogenase family)
VSEVARQAGRWTEADIPDQRGRTALITGANSGLGFHAAAGLARKGATVILACRDARKAADAAGRISALAPEAVTEVVRFDLASLDSVRAAADEVKSGHANLDLLINNAGLLGTRRGTTADGFELHFGTHHLGHFALTGLLLDRLLAAPGSRIVTVSSLGHRLTRLDFDDLQSSRRRVSSGDAYARSKLANVLFALELERRLAAAGAHAVSLAADPGLAQTSVLRQLPAGIRAAARPAELLLFQSAQMGALPVLRAATDPAARGGEYYCPGGRAHLTGYPEPVRPAKRARDRDAQRRLWEESQRLTGVTYPV